MVPTLVTELRTKIELALPDGRIVPAHSESEHFYKDTLDGEVYASVTTKTSILSRQYYKQMAADLAVQHLQAFMLGNPDFTPEEFTEACEYARQAHKVNLEQAGNWGTEAHDIVDKYVSSWINNSERPLSMRHFVPPNTTPHGLCGALSAEKFFKEWTLFPIVSEKKVLSKKHKYAGTLDSFFLVGEVYKEREGDKNCRHDWFEKGRYRVSCGTCGRNEKLTPSILDWKTSNQIFGHGAMGKYEYAMQVAGYDHALREMCDVKAKQHWIVRLDKSYPHYEIGVITNIKKATRMFLHMNEVSEFARSQVPPVDKLIKKNVITL